MGPGLLSYAGVDPLAITSPAWLRVDLITSGLAGWRMTVLMDSVAESGRKVCRPFARTNFNLGVDNTRTGARRHSQPSLSTPPHWAQIGTGKRILPSSVDRKRAVHSIRLVPNLPWFCPSQMTRIAQTRSQEVITPPNSRTFIDSPPLTDKSSIHGNILLSICVWLYGSDCNYLTLRFTIFRALASISESSGEK